MRPWHPACLLGKTSFMAAWVLALASSAHVALAVLRQHRSGRGWRKVGLLSAAYAFALAPWMWTGGLAVVVGLLAHGAWYVLTDAWAQTPGGGISDAPDGTRAGRATTGEPIRRTSPARPNGFTAATVIAVIDETPDIRTFRLARPPGLAFEAGQFLPLRVRIDGSDHVRCYSISSAPEAAGYVEISVKRQGLVSSALHDTVRPGSTLFVRAPAGRFVYPDDDDRPLVLVAGGVGITPLMSMVRHSLAAHPMRQVTLLHSARHADGLAYGDELRVLERRYPQFRWVPAVSGASAGAGHYPGRIDESLLRAAAPNLATSVVLMCGPDAMIADLRQLLASLGVPPSQVRHEVFEAVAAATGATARADQPDDPNRETSTAVVSFARSNVTGTVSTGDTLLAAAEASGVEIPTLCRAGVCGTCRTRVISGEVDCPSDALEAGDVDSGYVLACVAQLRADCAIEA